VAARRPHTLEAHGRARADDWYWLSDRSDPEVIAYLEAENAYAEAVLAPTVPLQEELFARIRSRIAETDVSAPVRHGPWWYWWRTFEGRQYGVICRRPDTDHVLRAEDVVADARSGRPAAETGEQQVLDENELAATSGYFATGVAELSPDHRILAYAVDLNGSERFTMRFRDLESGEELSDVIEDVYYGAAWSADSGTLFYVRPDQAMRPWQVWRHGIAATEDVLVYQEDDEHFYVGVALTRSERAIVIDAVSQTTSDARWIDAGDPTGAPRVILPREPGIEYDVDHDGSGWLVRTNRPDGGERAGPGLNFALYRLAEGAPDPSALEPVITRRDDVNIDSADVFAGFVVVAERWQSDGLERLRVIDRASGGQHLIEQPESVYSVIGEPNPEWNASTYRFGYTSLVTPRSSVSYDLVGRGRRTVWEQPVLGGYDPSAYRTERLWAAAPDGAMVPISLVARRDRPLDGPAPCLLYGYGAYEMSMEPAFSPLRLNLLERGVSFAIAHVRGGGELGRRWYEQGRMEHKSNTFTDFVAAAAHLIDAGETSADRLAARGGSAGGLLMGAVVNLRPDLWRAVVAEVPFVDVVTTMSDPELPLTVTEWEEWGDPVHDPVAFERMLAYSPYDNVQGGPHPAMFVTGGLNDPRVGYWEPAKWVAKLRSLGVGTPERPLLLRTEMGAGHRGSTGRYDAWRDEARVQAFLLWQLGQKEEPGLPEAADG
jgi:oligopeptidase B